MWTYTTSVEWSGGEAGVLKSPGKPALDFTPPPEFGGKEEFWSPEDLLVGAVESCMLLTLLFFVDKMKIGMTGYRSQAAGELDRTSSGLRFQGITVRMEAEVATAEDRVKFKKAAEQAEKYCPVSAAVNCPVTLVAEAAASS
jgi:organic hydroperoxide reductase OsmC/OhrA